MIENYKIGDVVRLKSDTKCRLPMTITKKYSMNEFQVCWIDEKGDAVYNGFSAGALTKVNDKVV